MGTPPERLAYVREWKRARRRQQGIPTRAEMLKTHCPRGHSYAEHRRPGRSDCAACRRKAPAAPPTHCKNGHPLTPGNLRTSERHNGQCLVCHRDRERVRRARNPGPDRASARAYGRTHRAQLREYHREWRRRNAARLTVYNRERGRLRLARKDPETAEYLRIISADPCVYCGAATEQIDHIQAVSTGGPNHWTNYAPACAHCNRSKSAKPLLTYLLERAR